MALLEELLGEGASHEVDRSVHAVEQGHEPREMGRQVGQGTLSGYTSTRFHSDSQAKIATIWVIACCDLCRTKRMNSRGYEGGECPHGLLSDPELASTEGSVIGENRAGWSRPLHAPLATLLFTWRYR
jgi:hypothetical protein